MANAGRSERRSRAAIGGHPIHPMIIPFPVAFLASAVATDVIYLGTRDKRWAGASRSLLQAGLMAGSVAAPFGLMDFLAIGAARRTASGWLHLVGNVAALGFASANLAQRRGRPEKGVFPAGFALSLATAGLLIATVWHGGELVFRYGVGSSAIEPIEPEEPESLAQARRRGRLIQRRASETPGTPVMAPEATGAASPELVALRDLHEPGRED